MTCRLWQEAIQKLLFERLGQHGNKFYLTSRAVGLKSSGSQAQGKYTIPHIDLMSHNVYFATRIYSFKRVTGAPAVGD